MAHQHTRSFLTDPASLVMATRQAVTNLRWRVTGEDPAHWVIYAATRASTYTDHLMGGHPNQGWKPRKPIRPTLTT